MIKLAQLAFTLFVFLLLNIDRQEEVQGIEWVPSVIKKFQLVRKLTENLDQLYMVPIDDPSRKRIIINSIIQFNSKLNHLSKYFSNSRKSNFKAIYSLAPFAIYEHRKNVEKIETRYDRMMSIISMNTDYFQGSDVKEFAEWNVNSGSHSVNTRLFEVFSKYFGYEDNSTNPFLDEIVSKFQTATYPPISIQQHLYSDYFVLTILEIKGYLISKFSWSILRNFDGIDFTAEEEKLVREHEKRTLFMADKLHNFLLSSRGELKVCDPKNWEENVNYEQVTRLVQGYIVNEKDLNPKGTCRRDCKRHINTKVHSCSGEYCKKDQVSNVTGNILKCESDSMRDFITICLSDNPARRYEYIETNRGFRNYNNFYGNNTSCPTNETLVKSWTRILFKCSYCFCLLDEKSGRSDRYFSLREVLSDVNENKVVTGVRFAKKNRVLYLQIQQGKLGPFGLIEGGTTDWKAIEDYQLRDEDDGVYYFTMDSEHRSINLDDLRTENHSYVITGVKFSVLDGHLRLEVRESLYEFESGTLSHPESNSRWISDTSKHEKKLMLGGLHANRGPNLSTRTPQKSIPSSNIFNYVEFSYSDKKDDASQTTLPFIDTQDVVSGTPTPLFGVGLYHKGLEGYGGFLAPKIFALDLSS